MASSKFTSNTKNSYYAVLTVSESSQSVANNKTTLKYSLVLYSGAKDFSGYTIGYSIYINGTRVAYHTNSGNQTSMGTNTSKTVTSGTTTVSHNSDGTKSVSVSFEVFTDNISYLPVSLTKSGTMTLTKIPRTSKLGTISQFNVDSSFSVPVTKYSSSFEDDIVISYDGTTVKTLNDYESGNSISFTTSEKSKIYSLMSNAVQGKGTFKFGLTTYSGSTKIGTTSATATGVITGADPVIEAGYFTYCDVNSEMLALTGNDQRIVKGYSDVKITAETDPQPQKGAAISSYFINGGASIAYTDGFSRVLEGYENDKVSIAVMDSRQITKSVDFPLELIEYEPVSKISCGVSRENNIGEMAYFSLAGRYWNEYFDEAGSVQNTITNVTYSYSKNGGESVQGNTIITLVEDGQGGFGMENIALAGDLDDGGWDIDARYTVRIIVSDKLTEAYFDFEIREGVPAMKISGNKVTHINGLVDLVYPVGAVYMSVNSTSPAQLFGGTWSQLKDRFLLGAGSTYTAGNTGGSATVKLTTSHMPSHKHTVNGGSHRHYVTNCSGSGDDSAQLESYGSGNTKNRSIYTNYDGGHTHTVSSAGGDTAHENMPPYLVVYMWKRTA